MYETEETSGGHRVLVDRIWPRGVAKADAGWDEWCKEVAPSTELRKWYKHDPDRFAEFRRRYLAELDDDDHRDAVVRLRAQAQKRGLTLLTATKDVDHSAAAVLADVLGNTG
ncbi:DUF488 family protein [Allosaccharopolyspora coralli]|uniref:DUF488 family protein n=1 Tax=Allosaccharopolyspora coralli TaxID=2665642 RepID=A0A5Q3Q8H7_9PSEU|nr:DUF488 family protein [Allosaccharopolyspora coralli]